MADSSILRLTKELAWIESEVLPALAGLRTGQHTLFDRIFANELAIAVHGAHEVGRLAVLLRAVGRLICMLTEHHERHSSLQSCCWRRSSCSIATATAACIPKTAQCPVCRAIRNPSKQLSILQLLTLTGDQC